MRKNFVSVKVYEKKFSIYYLKKFSKCMRKNFESVKVYEKIFCKCKSVWKKFCKCKSVWENIL